MNKLSNGDQKLLFLEYLRVVAFLSVFAGHLFPIELNAIQDVANSNFAFLLQSDFLWRGGAFGVVLFFLISGFVITLAAMRESVKVFVARRFFRIFPLFALTVLVFSIVSPGTSIKTTLLQLTLLGDFFGAPNALLGVDWTLRIEILFYAVFGILAVFIFNSRKPDRIVFLLFPVSVLVITQVLPAFPYSGWSYSYLNVFAPAFWGGIALALHFRKKVSARNSSALFLIAFLTSTFAQWIRRPDLDDFGPYILAAFAVFLAGYGLNNYLASSKVILLMANTTYSVYLFHVWLFPVIREQVKALIEPVGLSITLLGVNSSTVVTTFVFFALMFVLVKYFEQPIIIWSKRKFR